MNLIPYALAAGFAAAIITGAYYTGVDHGQSEINRQIAERNAKASMETDKVILTVNECHNSGGVWDRSIGGCVRSVQGQP